MTPDELKRLEEQTVDAIVAYRRDQSIEIEIWCDDHWESFHPDPPSWNPGEYYRIKPKRPREWDAYVDKDGRFWSVGEVYSCSGYTEQFKPVRVREVIDTPKEPKERREWKVLVRERAIIEFKPEIMDLEQYQSKGWRLATLVEKGGGE